MKLIKNVMIVFVDRITSLVSKYIPAIFSFIHLYFTLVMSIQQANTNFNSSKNQYNLWLGEVGSEKMSGPDAEKNTPFSGTMEINTRITGN